MTGVLCWPKKLLSAEDLRRHLTSQREVLVLPKTVITPLAADELKAKGVRVRFQATNGAEESKAPANAWAYAMDKPDATVASAVQALGRDGIVLAQVDFTDPRRFAQWIVSERRGGIAFCGDPATLCCIANKIAGVRAAAVVSVAQIVGIKKRLAANVFAIEPAGRTFFEVRQMLKAIVTGDSNCPAEIAKVLQELDGHAHR
ncbi:MAG: hypothetical protein HYR84_01440 [Planctomycetes bacterium]|nr:hypothetical protein [Planctomycetota bacterium]